MGTWIETLSLRIKYWLNDVAPFVGAWIETRVGYSGQSRSLVAPFVGAWIETNVHLLDSEYPWSHPLWVRGLKLPSLES